MTQNERDANFKDWWASGTCQNSSGDGVIVSKPPGHPNSAFLEVFDLEDFNLLTSSESSHLQNEIVQREPDEPVEVSEDEEVDQLTGSPMMKRSHSVLQRSAANSEHCSLL